MKLVFETEGEISQCICVISRNAIEMCRLSTASPDSERGRSKVAEKARAWIAEFLSRETSGAAPQSLESVEAKASRPAPIQATAVRRPFRGL
ncbi:hypothetical protein [Variovorax ginsengisoli]|uniref:Uncharacterized protein n=1 Tax=Variovorax ginsengisoli TaxID=363844 RepID=A0ABT8S7R0_9BURK|nr:hypothetical protein [Variovorax ginsengisoli]MDN8615675.1 hypothetical protein [Variovorax ginsengisoli]MDO1534845.1 hypothetical protein [Variovorax ginsengisoli]